MITYIWLWLILFAFFLGYKLGEAQGKLESEEEQMEKDNI